MAGVVSAAKSNPGITRWKNHRNGFAVFQIHYTADANKRTAEWKAEASRGMPARDWRREYEIDWTAPAGEPVIPEHDAQTHERELQPDPGKRLLRFWDPGFVSPAVLFAQLEPNGQLRVLAELAPFNTPLDQLCPSVWAITKELVGHDRVFDAGDPAAEAETDIGSVQATLRRYGIMLRSNRPGTEASYRALRKRFTDRLYVPGVGHEPAILVHPGRCPTLCKALRGAFHRSEHPPYNVVKEHPYKDVVDALRYGNDNLSFENQEFQQQMSQMARSDWQWQ